MVNLLNIRPSAKLLSMKLMIFLGIAIFGTIGGWIGAAASGGNWLSPWSILLSTVGSFFGIYAGLKAGQYFGF